MEAEIRGGPLQHGFLLLGDRLGFQVALADPSRCLDVNDRGMQQWRALDRLHVALEFRHGIDKPMTLADLLLLDVDLLDIDAVDAHHTDHAFHVRGFEFGAQVLDQMHEVGAVFLAALVIKQVIVALEPNKSRDFITVFLIVRRKMFFQVVEGLMHDSDQGAVLAADILRFHTVDRSGARRTEIHIQTLTAGTVFDQQHLFFERLAHEVTKRIFRADLAAQLVVVLATAEAGLQLVIDAAVGHPDIVAGDEIFAIGLESLQQGRPRWVLVFAEEIDGANIRLAIHVRLAREDEDFHGFRLRQSNRCEEPNECVDVFFHGFGSQGYAPPFVDLSRKSRRA